MRAQLTLGRDRAQVQLVDVFMGLILLVGMLVLAPVFYKFIGMSVAAADPFTGLLLRFFMPMLLLALLLSIGVSARTGGFG